MVSMVLRRRQRCGSRYPSSRRSKRRIRRCTLELRRKAHF